MALVLLMLKIAFPILRSPGRVLKVPDATYRRQQIPRQPACQRGEVDGGHVNW
jgi:hypothetical protein